MTDDVMRYGNVGGELVTYIPPIPPDTDSWVDVIVQVGKLADYIARTPFVPKAMQGNPAAVAASILTGRELGLGPMTSLRSINVIEGKPSLTSELLAARILAAGHRITWDNVSDTKVSVRIIRADGLSKAAITWTIGDAERAGLLSKLGGGWQKYPRAMLRARALSECAQLVCPDVSLGLDVAGAPLDPAPDATPVRVQVGTTRAAQAPAAEGPTASSQPADTEPQPGPGAPPDPGLINAPQLRKLNATVTDVQARMGKDRWTRDQRRALIMWAADAEAESTRDLTTAQASGAIDALESILQTPDDEPPGADARAAIHAVIDGLQGALIPPP